MSTHQIWSFVQEAKRKGVSMDKLAKIRSGDRQGGCRIGTVCYWQRKLLALSKTQSQLSMLGAQQLSLVTDGSTHSSRNFLVTLFYSCQNGIATFGTSQAISGSKVLYPNEMSLTREAERLAARREMERLSALKFMQALQAQLKHVSQNRMSLESFLTDDTLLPFLKPHAKRFSETVNLQTRHYVELEDGNELELALPDPVSVPILNILMDQSKVGLAAAAFLSSRSALMHYRYDKIHRLIRDIKGASSAGIFQEMLMATTWQFGVNYKPFGSGAFFDEKQGALQAFLMSNSSVTWLACVNFNCQLCQSIQPDNFQLSQLNVSIDIPLTDDLIVFPTSMSFNSLNFG